MSGTGDSFPLITSCGVVLGKVVLSVPMSVISDSYGLFFSGCSYRRRLHKPSLCVCWPSVKFGYCCKAGGSVFKVSYS